MSHFGKLPSVYVTTDLSRRLGNPFVEPEANAPRRGIWIGDIFVHYMGGVYVVMSKDNGRIKMCKVRGPGNVDINLGEEAVFNFYKRGTPDDLDAPPIDTNNGGAFDPLAAIRELAPVGSRWEFNGDRIWTVTGHHMHMGTKPIADCENDGIKGAIELPALRCGYFKRVGSVPAIAGWIDARDVERMKQEVTFRASEMLRSKQYDGDAGDTHVTVRGTPWSDPDNSENAATDALLRETWAAYCAILGPLPFDQERAEELLAMRVRHLERKVLGNVMAWCGRNDSELADVHGSVGVGWQPLPAKGEIPAGRLK